MAGAKDPAAERRPQVSHLSVAAVVISMTLPILALVYSTGREVNSIQQRLDRNCRILSVIHADVRFIIIEHTGNRDEAQAFRELFQRAVADACGNPEGSG